MDTPTRDNVVSLADRRPPLDDGPYIEIELSETHFIPPTAEVIDDLLDSALVAVGMYERIKDDLSEEERETLIEVILRSVEQKVMTSVYIERAVEDLFPATQELIELVGYLEGERD